MDFIGSLLAQAIDPCPIALACPGGAADAYFSAILVNAAMFAFPGVLFALLIYYGLKLIIGSDNDSTVTEVYNAYAHAAIGCVLAGGAFYLSASFATPGTPGLVIAAPAQLVILNAANVFRALLATALVFNLTYQAFRLVTSQDESQTEKAKKQFIYGMVGAVIVVLAGFIVDAFWGVQSGIISVQVIGIANFLGTILGAFCLIAMFVAGMYLVISVDEQYKEKAKKIIQTAMIVLGVTMMSVALIRFAFDAPQGNATGFIPASFVMHAFGIETVYAQGPLEKVGGSLMGVAPGQGFGGIAAMIGYSLVFFVNVAALIAIVIAGMLAVVAQDEGRIAKSRKTVVMAVMGMVLVNLAVAFRNGYLIAFGVDTAASPSAGAAIIGREIIGFLGFVELPVTIFAVLTIIIYGIKAVVDYGGENGIASFRKAVMSVMLGIAILSVKFFIAGAVIPFDPTGLVAYKGTSGIIDPAVNIIVAIVKYAALLAVVAIIIAGIFMVFSVGKEDQYTKAKGIVIRTLIGLFVMVISAALLGLVIQGVF